MSFAVFSAAAPMGWNMWPYPPHLRFRHRSTRTAPSGRPAWRLSRLRQDSEIVLYSLPITYL